MKELFTMWRNTRMVVLTAICAAVYVAVLIPFKILPIIPGFTEIRPAAIVPIVCSVLFGPAAAWGAGLGNVIGDFLGGMFGPGSLFGFLGNFLLGFVPYKLFGLVVRYDPLSRGVDNLARFGAVMLITCCACSATIGWGLDLLGLVPFAALANIVLLNNLVLNCLLSPFVLALVYRRVKQMGLVYTDVLGIGEGMPGVMRVVGTVLMIVGAVGGMAAGNLVGVPAIASVWAGLTVSWAVAPFIACMLVALVLL